MMMMMMMMELFPSSLCPMEIVITSPTASHRREKRWKVSPSEALFLLSTREALFAVSSLTAQRCPRHRLLTPYALADWTHRCSFKKSLLTLIPDHSPPTTHSAKWASEWDSQWFLWNKPQSQPNDCPWLWIYISPRKAMSTPKHRVTH